MFVHTKFAIVAAGVTSVPTDNFDTDTFVDTIELELTLVANKLLKVVGIYKLWFEIDTFVSTAFVCVTLGTIKFVVVRLVMSRFE
jgi:hypothetical protein